MSDAKFKTMRHIETVRNYINVCIVELLDRQTKHDQSKLRSPEAEALEVFTPRLRGLTYGSEEYKKCLEEMKDTINSHYRENRHHPEFHRNGIEGMNLIDLLEMIADWKAATLRHDNGDIYRSLILNKERYNLDPQLYNILWNTVEFINNKPTIHFAEES